MNTVLNTISIFFCPQSQYRGPGHGFFGQWPHMMPFGGLIMWILIILAIVIIIVLFSKRRPSDFEKNITSKEETALDILKKRYAKGEITKEEYEHMKKDIE